MPHSFKEPVSLLLVEDDPVTVSDLKPLLERCNISLAGCVSDGEAALAAAATTPCDIVLMDLMPTSRMDGFTTCRLLVERHMLPVVLMTSSGAETVAPQLETSGAAAFINKPVRLGELLVNLRLALRQNRYKRELEMQRTRYRHFFDNAMVGLFRGTEENRFAVVNKTLATMLGYASPEEFSLVVAEHPDLFYVEDDTPALLKEKLQQQGEVKDFEYQAYGKDGDILWLHESLRVLDENGEVMLAGAIQEVTARIHAEQEAATRLDLLQMTINAVSDLIFLTDLNLDVILCNDAFCAQLGLPREQILGRNCQEIFAEFKEFTAEPPRLPPPSSGGKKRNGTPPVHFKHENKHFHMSMSPFHNPGEDAHEVIGAVYVCRPLA